MGGKLITMDSQYREKHYPKGLFGAMTKDARGGGVALVICGILLALMGAGALWLLAAMLLDEAFDSSEDIGVKIFFGFLGLLYLGLSLLVAWMGIRRGRSGENDWLQKSVEVSGYPESTIRDFADQAMEDGSLKLLLGASRSQGFLTRDYIFFYNLLYPCVIRIEDIVGAYLVQTPYRTSSYTANVNGKRIKMYNNNINVISNHNTSISSEAHEDMVRQLLDILTKKNPAIDTEGGRLLSESEYEEKEAQVIHVPHI